MGAGARLVEVSASVPSLKSLLERVEVTDVSHIALQALNSVVILDSIRGRLFARELLPVNIDGNSGRAAERARQQVFMFLLEVESENELSRLITVVIIVASVNV